MIQKFGEMFENVQQAKAILKKLNIPLTDERFQTLRAMLEKTPGWTGAFTRFCYEQDVSVDDLAQLYDRLKQMQGVLSRLPQPVDKYEQYEKLIDDLDLLEGRDPTCLAMQDAWF